MTTNLESSEPAVAATAVFFRRVPLTDLVNNCMFSVLQQGILFSLPILIMCFLFKVLCHTVGEGFENSGMTFIPRQIIHISSGCLGVVILHHMFQEHALIILSLGAMGYFMLVMSRNLGDWKMAGAFAVLVCFITEFICETSMVPEAWHRIRGPVIILSMKIISIGFDLDADLLLLLPGIFEYFGYIFNIGTVVFGPWISFLDYMTILQIKQRQMNISWIFVAFRAYLLSLLCLLYSTCLSNWLIMDGSYKWYLAFRDSQSFRFSHYFTCYVSEAMAVASGVGTLRVSSGMLHGNHANGSGGSSKVKDSHHKPHREFSDHHSVRWDLKVTRPLFVEFPRSLVDVVINWHIPMHRWLKQYVFWGIRDYGGTVPALIATYAASSLLHGLNFQFFAVLLSLAFYSSVEYLLRRRLAHIFSCCIEARRCRGTCGHCNSRPWAVNATNLGFSLLTIYHLTYLGLMFDSSHHQEKVSQFGHLFKWAQLDFASHLVSIVMLLFYLLIR